jgi:Secretion system C-terminal sorting domain
MTRDALLALLLPFGSAAGQSHLLVSPDTLYLSKEDVVTLSNPFTEGVSLDSLALRITGPRAYHVEVSMPDSTYGPYYLNVFGETSFSVGTALAAGDSAQFSITGFDPCVICAGGRIGFGPDTLLVYSGGVAVPNTMLIDLSTYVATEPDPLPPELLQLVAFPNPASAEVTIRFGTALTKEVEITTFDALGRVVGRQRLAAGANPELVIQTHDLPAGTYYVRASVEGGRQAVLPFTVTR